MGYLKNKQTRDQLEKQLLEQVNFIQKSAREFDSGDISEAKRIATHTRILLHDTKQSISLLTLMDDKGNVLFLNSASAFNPRSLMPYMGLVGIRSLSDTNGFSGKYYPRLDTFLQKGDVEDWKSFDDWWGGIIIKDQKGNTFSRKDLICHVANKDGGAHVDGSLPDDYADLSRYNSLGFFTVEKRPGEVEQKNDIAHIELFSIRQIGFEITSSLTKYLSLIK